ncbi:E3 ubiquitin-protein ligase TRIM69-like [Tachysurus fulvidraco]|uniref:E3 ubiquitin-protein ligase TRIM69-like n=1 Tax=Tachysurus fulvidraco TaxID=1234273 RepID=UPI001FEEB49E|nr:E3 ubiquitin-protein ligase TRIM69-like [Tachysurus fulvidraco]XP_026990783.2 E3 ubiquitin-protein ligase TRIM69-like [Tachysurus fulvidraco]XP_026990784.2 E3 ubiquitin-protein ligase TRIM69-like [Tachysurus fulvidraco]XP_047672595.1 E3 ubiquitin-protein ligase TRIM69-like [Tachysurus fulvidraco]
MEFMHTSSYEPDSEECDEFEDMSPNQQRLSPASMCSDQGTDQLETRIQGLLGESCYAPISPAASYCSMKSAQSMIDPLKFSQGADVRKVIDQVSPTPTLVSVQSEQSIELPVTVNSRESCTSLMMKEHLRCSMCKYMLKEPVTIPCGHSFCRTCIESYWSKISSTGCYSCPQCRKRFKSRPALNLNFTLSNVVLTQQHVAISLAHPTLSDVGPGDVACDSCSGRKIRAVKSCLTCQESYCEAHVRQHYTVEALQKHTLMEPKKIAEA